VLDAALDEGAGGALEIAGDAAGVDAGAALLDVPAVGVLVGETTGVDVDVLACLELELHAVANATSATSAAVRR